MDKKGNVKGGADAQQRGVAAHARQKDNNNPGLLNKDERHFANEVVHHRNEKHTPGFDKKLEALGKK